MVSVMQYNWWGGADLFHWDTGIGPMGEINIDIAGLETLERFFQPFDDTDE
jgi:hypothetical protein